MANENRVAFIISADGSGAIAVFGKVGSGMQKLGYISDSIVSRIKTHWKEFSIGMAGVASSIYVVKRALRGLEFVFNQTFGRALRAVDDYKTNVASSAAVILTFMKKQKGVDLGSQWEQAYNYAERLVPVLENIAATTLLSGQQVQMLFTEFAKGGVFLDADNEKAVKGFKAMANTIAIMTKGQDTERQILTEIRALMEGQERAGAVIIKMMAAIDPRIKEHLKIWQAEGTALEHMSELLAGFDKASGKLEITWTAIKTRMQTTVTQVMRGQMFDAYEGIMKFLMRIDDYLQAHKEIISQGIYRVWIIVKSTIESVWNILKGFQGPLTLIASVVGKIAEGWGLILTILPPVTERIGKILQSIWEMAKAIFHFGEVLWEVASLDFSGAKAAYAKAKAEWNEAGKLSGQAFSSGLIGEIDQRLNDYYKKSEIIVGGIKPPKAAPFAGDETIKKTKEIHAWLLDEDMKMMKAQEDAWLKFIKESIAYDEYMQKQAEENQRRLKEEQNLKMQIQEAEIKHQLFLIDLKEQEFKISKSEAAEQRLAYYQELLESQEKFLSTLDKTADASAWYAQQDAIDQTRQKIVEVNQAVKELNGTFKEGLIEGLNKYIRSVETNFEKGEKIVDITTQSMENNIMDFLDSASKGFLKFGDLVKNILQEILKELLMLEAIKPFINWLSSFGKTLLGGDVTGQEFLDLIPEGQHTGGLVGRHKGGYIPEFHFGRLNSNERIVINKVGERYITEEQNDWLTKIANTMKGNGSLTVNVPITIDSGNKKMISELRNEIKETVIRVIRNS